MSVIPFSDPRKHTPPSYMTEEQKEIWHKVIDSESSDLFKSVAQRDLLEVYCTHVTVCRSLTTALNRELGTCGVAEDNLSYVNALMKTRNAEIASLNKIATSMRLTNQSRFMDKTAKVHAPESKTALWDVGSQSR